MNENIKQTVKRSFFLLKIDATGGSTTVRVFNRNTYHTMYGHLHAISYDDFLHNKHAAAAVAAVPAGLGYEATCCWLITTITATFKPKH